MKSMFKCSSLIRVVVIMVVMAFMASQVTETYAGRKNRDSSNNENHNHQLDKKGRCKICGKIIKIIINNNYGPNGQNGNGNGNGNGGNAECPTCCDAWDKQLGDGRFVLVMPTEANPEGEAVRDNETCLVWEQSPSDSTFTWTQALVHCFTKKVGDRKGWRAPTIEELATLVDDTQAAPTIPAELKTLTSNVQSSSYWSSTTNAFNTTLAWLVIFSFGVVNGDGVKDNSGYVWCVRGGQGHDAY